MADNENLEEFNESTEDPEAQAGFDEGAGDGEGKDDGAGQDDKGGTDDPDDPGKDNPPDDPDKDEKDKGDDPDKDKGEKETPPEEKTAAQRAEERAAKYKEDGDPDDPDKGKEKPDGEGDDPDKDKGKSSPYTKEQIKDYLGIISDEDLPEEIVIGNDTVDLKALKEAYPEDFSSIKVLAGITASKIAQKMIDEGGYVKAADIQETMQGFQNEITRLRFLDTVRDAHPDVNTVRKSPEFKAWVEAQPKHMQRLANSWDADDAVAILDAYKESEAKKAAEKHDKGLKDKKEKKDGLMSDGVRKKTSAPKTGDDDDKNDFEGGFNDAISGKN